MGEEYDEESLEWEKDGELDSSSTHGLLAADAAAADFDLEDVINAMDAELNEENRIPVGSSGTGPGACAQDGGGGGSIGGVLGNDVPVPITRVPTSSRDSVYAVAFGAHFALIIMLSFFEGASLESSIIAYGKAGSWASMFMIVTVLGAFLGCLNIFLLANWNKRDELLAFTVPFSIFSQVVFGLILVLQRTRYSPLASLVFLSALVDSFKFSRARESVSFASAVLSIVISILNRFGLFLVVTCVCLVLAQTFVLLWWGSFFVGLVASVHEAYADVLSVIMLISLYWTQQVFQAMVSYIVGGCTLWYFVKREGEDLHPQKRVLLHLQCGMTAGFGSICKGALYSNAAMYVLEIHDWSRRADEGGLCTGMLRVVRGLVGQCVRPLLPRARCFHRLGFCLAATYGRTFCRSAADQSAAHEETLDIAIEDTTTHILSAMAKQVPAVLAIMFGMFVKTNAKIVDPSNGSGTGIAVTDNSTRSWSLLFLICYLLSYCGCSLALSTYRSAVDALIVAFGEKPDKLAKENQIVFSRFLRLMKRHDP